MYDPSIGRWLEADPIGFAAGDANLYRFVGNDPLNKTDPSGLVEMAPTYTEILNERRGGSNMKVPALHRSDYKTAPNIEGRTLSIRWTMSEEDFDWMRKGCIGLCSLRTGSYQLKFEGQAAIGKFPKDHPDAKVFTSLEEAMKYQAEAKDKITADNKQQTHSAVLVTVAFERDTSDKLKYFDKNKAKIDPKSLDIAAAGRYDFGTAFQDKNGNVVYWEHMPYGEGMNPKLIVQRDNKMPFKYHYYLVVITDSPYRPFTVVDGDK